jgi:3-hydroxybutyryl-CoA dehydrogenase
MKIENVMIAGGTLGSQIAWQTAFMGFKVVVYDAFDKG